MDYRKWLDDHLDEIKKLYPGTFYAYGPYNNSSDGRTRVVLYDGLTRKTRQFCKLKVEVNQGRLLSPNDTVDHNDGNHSNDEDDNLIVRSRSEHCSLDVKRRKKVNVSCVYCGTQFTASKSQMVTRKKKSGPFCSRECSGKYGTDIQKGKDKLPSLEIPKEYTTLKQRII